MAQLLAPAKRASICLFVLAGLMIPCGGLMGLMGAFLAKADFSQVPAETAAMLRQVEQQFASMGITMSGFFLGLAVFMLVMGMLALLFGVMVRRGGLGSIVSSIILCCVMGLLAGISVLGGFPKAVQGDGQALAGVCVWGLMLVFLLFALVSLFQAARNSGKLNAARMGYQSQMQQYQQGYPGQPQQPSQQPQSWQQSGPGQWGQPAWPPQPQQPPQPPQQQQNWPPPPAPPPSNPT
jgi:hypothetical protein